MATKSKLYSSVREEKRVWAQINHLAGLADIIHDLQTVAQNNLLRILSHKRVLFSTLREFAQVSPRFGKSSQMQLPFKGWSPGEHFLFRVIDSLEDLHLGSVDLLAKLSVVEEDMLEKAFRSYIEHQLACLKPVAVVEQLTLLPLPEAPTVPTAWRIRCPCCEQVVVGFPLPTRQQLAA